MQNVTDVGMLIQDNIKVNINDSFDELIEKIKMAKLDYSVPFSKVSKKSNILETMVHIESKGLEISLEDNIVVFIKSIYSDETNILDESTIEKNSMTMPDILNTIKEYIKNYVGDTHVSIEKFDAKTYNTVVVFSTNTNKIRASILKANNGSLFLNTIRKL